MVSGEDTLELRLYFTSDAEYITLPLNCTSQVISCKNPEEKSHIRIKEESKNFSTKIVVYHTGLRGKNLSKSVEIIEVI